jgi:hypothetical protein
VVLSAVTSTFVLMRSRIEGSAETYTGIHAFDENEDPDE